MNKSITQATQDDKQISKSIKRFFTRFHVSSALKASNAYKKKGIPVTEIFQYLFLLIFSNRSMYMSLITGRNTPGFAKDSVYRFMKMIQTNWIRFTTILSSRIIKDAILPPDSKDRANVLIIDDSMFERNRSKKVELRGRSRYLLSVMVDVVKDGEIIPAKVVYVRNRNKRKEYLCLISTDTNLDENEIIRIYGKRWDIEVFFKVCKSYLNLSRECNSLSYDAMTAHTAVVFTRYMMLSLESRESNDNRSLGELFLYFSDEMSDITWIQAFQMLLQMFRTMLTENTELSDEKISELVDAFMNALPALLKTQLQAA